MQRIEIRNINSSKPTKPRMFDALIDDEGKIYFESKVHKNTERIALTDVMKQIKEAQTSY